MKMDVILGNDFEGLFILKIRVTEGGEGTKKECYSIGWFTPQMATMATAKPGQSN